MKKLSIILIILPAVIISQLLSAQEKTAKIDSARVELLKAQTLFRQGKKEEASVICISIMESSPDNKEAVQWWLIMNMKRSPTGELEAVNMLDSLNKIYPNNTGLLFFKTFIQAEYGKNEEALAGFNKLIALQPDSALNYIGKGQVLSTLKRHQEAFVAFDKATSLNPGRFDVWGMKASTLAKLGKFEEAVAAMNKEIELAPGFAEGFYNRACIFSLKGDKAKALADLKKAIEMKSSLKKNAATDEDFKSLWEDQDFMELLK